MIKQVDSILFWSLVLEIEIYHKYTQPVAGKWQQAERRRMRLAVNEVKKNHEIIINMYKSGRTTEEIGNAIGYSTMSVNNILRDQGIRKYKKRIKIEVEEGQQDNIPAYKIAKDRRRIKRVYIRGKRYLDITDLYAGI